MIRLAVHNFSWINGVADDPDDQCAHGKVEFSVDDCHFVRPEDGELTVSAAGLFLLRSLTDDNTEDNPIAECNFMFPCCGRTAWIQSEGRYKVLCMGCNIGVDVAVRHDRDLVSLAVGGIQVTVKEAEWRRSVLAFCRQVEDFYSRCAPKTIMDDEPDRNGWAAFWAEWGERSKNAKQVPGSET